ncbi:MAG: FAD-dependent monooxygenase [Bacteroidia bacterium]|nr:FAD-dependent monooxygenase [Bacteroidia bacterium]
MEKKETVAIIGGGLSGSLLACCLAKRGFKVSLYERRGDFRETGYLGGRSINLALSERGINALKKVNLADSVLDDAIAMNGRVMHSVAGELSYQPYGKAGQYINSVSRSGLNLKLIELADEFENVTLYFNYKCIDADLKNNTAIFETAEGEKVSVKADIMLGTDGAFSAIRSEMQHTERFNFSQQYENYGYKELEIVPGPDNKFMLEEHALHIWPRGEFMMIALPNPGGNFTCTLFMPYTGVNGLDKLKTEDDVKVFFNKYFADALPLMPGYIHDFFNNPTGSLLTVRCSPWVRGRFALVGDAAHAVVPFYGQGMNCSFEDVAVLDELIDKHYPDWDKVLSEYQDARIDNANAIADLALKNFVEMRDLVGHKDFLEFKHIEHDLCDLYPDKFKSQYELTTFTNMPYRYAWNQGFKNEQLIKAIISEGLKEKLEDRELMNKMFEKYL